MLLMQAPDALTDVMRVVSVLWGLWKSRKWKRNETEVETETKHTPITDAVFHSWTREYCALSLFLSST